MNGKRGLGVDLNSKNFLYQEGQFNVYMHSYGLESFLTSALYLIHNVVANLI